MMTTITTLGAIVMTPLLCKLLLGTVVPVDAVGIAFSTVQVRGASKGSTWQSFCRHTMGNAVGRRF